MHPVRLELMAAVHSPGVSFGMTGGNGSSVTSMGSGLGGEGVF
jgi:hypothetical protein